MPRGAVWTFCRVSGYARIMAKQSALRVTKPARVRRPIRAKERKRLSVGINTEQRLLDASELMFAEYGYEGTSLRIITDEAGEHVGLMTYYFKTKERLFDRVVQRRAAEMHRLRLAALKEVGFEARSPLQLIRTIIWAYVGPMIKARLSDSSQWQAHVRIMASLMNQKRWVPLIRKHYDPCAAVFLEHYRQALPEVNFDSLLNAFSFVSSNMLYVCSFTDRFGEWKENQSQTADERLQAAIDDFMDFACAGFMTLAQKKVTGSPRKIKIIV
jgi:AcrR family transcriptional regulator